jgi:hypothetical protein
MKIAQMLLNDASFTQQDVEEFYADYQPTEQDIADMQRGWDEIETNLSEVDYVEQFENALLYGDGDLPW